MTTHNGLLTVITDEGDEIPVTANLRTGPSIHGADWGGSLTVSATAQHPALKNLTRGRLRFTDGKEAQFVRENTSDWLDSPAGTYRMRINGSDGDVPF